MPQIKHFQYASADRLTQIHAIWWIPDGEIHGIIQVVHGMQEFIDRYEEFAQFMNQQGILVAGHDHLGHGASIRSEAHFGYFAEESCSGLHRKHIPVCLIFCWDTAWVLS